MDEVKAFDFPAALPPSALIRENPLRMSIENRGYA
jgi:hypothetical protein